MKDFYWLKVNRFLLTLRSFSWPQGAWYCERIDPDEEIREAKQEALRALRALITHLKGCYALDQDLDRDLDRILGRELAA